MSTASILEIMKTPDQKPEMPHREPGGKAQAVELVNRLDHGVANSVWSADLARANRVAGQLVAGNSWINAHNVFAYGLPYGGVNSPAAFYDYLRDQTVARPLA